MAARRKSDTKSKETPSQSAAPPLYHRVLPLSDVIVLPGSRDVLQIRVILLFRGKNLSFPMLLWQIVSRHEIWLPV